MANWAGMAGAVRDAWPAVANHLWQSTAFVVVAAGLALALRKNAARARHWVWMAASMKFLLPFALLAGVGSYFARPKVVAAPKDAAVYFAMEDFSEPFAGEMAAGADPTHAAIEPRHEWGTQAIPLVLGGAWLAGFVTVLVAWWVRWRRVARMVRAAEPAGEGRVADALRRMAQAAGVKRAIELRVMAHPQAAMGHPQMMMEPGVFGIFRPVLLWPEGISARLDDAHLEAVLAHEVCHVRRRDNLTAAAHMLVEAAFWFHPLAWWVGARLVAERERACDEEVLRVCGRPGAYAEGILKVCEFCVEAPVACVAGVTGADLKQRVLQIMTARTALRLGWGKKLLLGAAVLCALAVPVAFGVLRMIPVYGQVLHATGPLPAFEVVAIKPARPDERGMGFNLQGRHFRTINTSVSDLVKYAYGVQSRQIEGALAWAETEKYDITGVAPENEEGDPSWKPMVQKLLADRFGFSFHSGTKEMPVYELQVAKNGPKLTQSTSETGHGDLYVSNNASGPGSTIHGKSQTMEGLAKLLEGTQLDRPVVDRTGLTGDFDFEMTFLSDHMKGKAIGPAVEDEPNAPPGIFTAIQEQLGLKLVPSKGPTEIMVIDHIEKPVFDTAEVPRQAGVMPVAMAQGQTATAGAAQPTSPAPPKPMLSVPSKPVEFDIATFKPSRPNENRTFDIPANGDGFSFTARPIHDLIRFAFAQGRGGAYQISGQPGWVDTQLYDVQAKVAPEDIAEWQQLDALGQKIAMQRFILEYLKLKYHPDPAPYPYYALAVGKDGPKMPLYKPGDTFKARDGHTVSGKNVLLWVGPNELVCQGCSVERLAEELSGRGDRAVLDQTGLTSQDYDIDLRFKQLPDPNNPDGPSTPFRSLRPRDANAVMVSSVKQLGLELKPAKGPIDGMVIDHIERPPEN